MAKKLSELPINAKVKFGSLYGSPIVWKVADKNYKGFPNNSVTLLSDQIIKLMCFDAKEPSSSDSGRKNLGNNRYGVSNIRQWLNSDAGVGGWYTAQHSTDAPPNSSNVSRTYPYESEAGFLNAFREKEKNSLLNTTLSIRRPSSALDGSGYDTCVDKVFLIPNEAFSNSTNFACFNGNASSARTATISNSCAENHIKYPDNPSSGTAYTWWTSYDSVQSYSTVVCIQGDGTTDYRQANTSGVGLRPACNLSADTLVSDNTSGGAYTIIWNTAPTTPSSINVPGQVNGGKTLSISWSASSDPDGNLSGYWLERKVDSGSWTQIYQGASLSYQDTITKGWGSVTYRVKAYDSEGLGSAYITSQTRTVINNTAPTITCELSGNLGTRDAGFRVAYTIGDIDEGDSVTVEEAIDGKVKRSFAAVLGQSNSFDVTGEYFQKLLNGNHTLTITAADAEGEKAVHRLTFTKAVYACRITMKEPMPSASLITKMVLSVSRSIPEGANFSVQVTNNGKDDSPVWEDATSSVNSGINYLFQNTTAVKGSAYNFILTASRKEGGEGGYISSIGGAFEPDKQAGPDYAGTLKVNVKTDDGGSWGNTRVRVTNNLFGQKFYPLDALGQLTLQLLANQTYTVRLVDIPEKYYSQTQMVDIKSQETAALNFTLSTKPDVVGYRIKKATGEVEYIEGAAGMEPAHMDFAADKNYPGDWGDHWLFRRIRPCLLKDGEVQYYLNPDDYTKKSDGLDVEITKVSENIMVEFPLVYAKEYEDDTYNYCLMCSENWDGSFHASAFTNQNGVVQETMYIGAYEGSDTLSGTWRVGSRSGAQPSSSYTIGEYRTRATNHGPGYQQLEWSKHSLLQNLFVMKYKGLNSQALLGKGNVNSSAALKTGTMNQKGMDWGDQTGTNGVKFCGIEHPWGNLWKFCDGLGVDTNGMIVYKANPPYSDSLSGYQQVGIHIGTNGFAVQMRSGIYGKIPVGQLNGTKNTFYGDQWYFSSNTNTYICYLGSSRGNADAGIFTVNISNPVSYTGQYVGARLCYTPQ